MSGGAAATAGIATSLAFVVGAGGASDLGQQVGERTDASATFGRLVASLLLGSFLTMAVGEDADVYVHRPTRAGRLIESTVIPADQRFAWSVGFTDLRVLSYYLDRPTLVLTDVELAHLSDDELIFVDLERLPDWYPVVTAPVAARHLDGFAFVRADTLRESLDDDPGRR